MDAGTRRRLVVAAATVVVATALAPAVSATTTAVRPAAGDGVAFGGATDWRVVSAGGAHSCGIRTSGRLYCWGADDSGQLGDGEPKADQATPVEVAGGATNWASVTVGGSHTCARKTTGRVLCWGYDGSGRLGDGTTIVNRSSPVVVAGPVTNWAAISAGDSHTCAVSATGRLYCWGYDGSGRLGNGPPSADQPVPVEVSGGATNWTAVSAGGHHTCARKANGRLFCWGLDGSGQVGDGGTDLDRDVPIQVSGHRTDWATVTLGGVHTCATRTIGRLYCWGEDSSGQVGDGPPFAHVGVPVTVAGGAVTWSSVDAGGSHTCGRQSSGRLYCWGYDAYGQVGDGVPLANQPSPVAVGSATDWRTVSAGAYHSCGRRASGRLFCWGRNHLGQLGDDGTGTDQPTPVEVAAPPP